MIIAFTTLLVACLFQGTLGICLKKFQPFSWESFWLLFSIVGVLIIPHVWTYFEIPNYMKYIKETPTSTLFLGALSGFFWGITAILYGKAIVMIGISLVVGINVGVSNLFGSLIPMIILNHYPSNKALGLLLVGQVIIIIGVIILSRAGMIKNRGQEEKIERKQGQKSSLFVLGLSLAIISGLGSAAINIGAVASSYPTKLAVDAGVNATSASLLSWVVVFAGGFIANAGYALYKVIANKSYGDYVKPGNIQVFVKVLLAGIVWFAALAFYGKASALLGTLGPVVGWIMFNGLSIVVANAWGFWDGEWKGFPKARNVSIWGNTVLVLALVIIGIANNL